MKNNVKKLGAMIVQGEEEDRFWILVNNVIENRSKLNELIEFTDERTLRRDEQIENLKAEIRDYKRELMEYHNLLLQQKSMLEEANKVIKESSKLYLSVAEEILKIKKVLKIG